MGTLLLLILAVTSSSPAQFTIDLVAEKKKVAEQIRVVGQLAPIFNGVQFSAQSINDINLMLHHEASNLNQLVINKVLMTLKCASAHHIDHNNILTIIDYSLPSNEKRLWVFDLKNNKLLFNTYVSHGIKSGALLTNYFSNKNNSKASSIGVYQTQKAYYGRDGLSLRLDGLDRNFNDNASNRAVVMHSGWYVEERFIKKYGRPGRSWGCPALPLQHSNEIINTIKEKSLLVIYYPSDNWFAQSKFLNCDNSAMMQTRLSTASNLPAPEEQRDDILFVAEGYKGTIRSESKPVAVISADRYQDIFHVNAPLTRMLRRQINNVEYIALSTAEFNYLANNSKINTQPSDLNAIYFVIPVLKEVRRGYYETQMQIVNLGKIKEVKVNSNFSREKGANGSFTLLFEGNSSMNLTASNQFIRWVGL